MNKTDREILLEIFRKADIPVNYTNNITGFEIELNSYSENVWFDFDENGNLIDAN